MLGESQSPESKAGPFRAIADTRVPEELTSYAQWVGWKRLFRDGKLTKVPVDLRWVEARVDDPETFAEYAVALPGLQQSRYDGIGFVFRDTDPFSGIDLDNCRNPETGEIAEWALRIVRQLNSYTK